MRKIRSLILCMVLLVGLTACGDDTPKKSQIETYVEENADALRAVFASYLRETDLTYKSEIRVEDKTIIIDYKIYEFDELSDDSKYRIQRAYTDISSEVEESYEKYIEEMPSLEYMIINILETDGDNVASIKIYC